MPPNKLSENMTAVRHLKTYDADYIVRYQTLHCKYGAGFSARWTARGRESFHRLHASSYVHCCPCSSAFTTTALLQICILLYGPCFDLVHRQKISVKGAGLVGFNHRDQCQAAVSGYIDGPLLHLPSPTGSSLPYMRSSPEV